MHRVRQEMRSRRGLCCSTKPAPVLAPRPIPAWLHGRCCRYLVTGHCAAKCRDPFRCSRCLENGHRARGCRNDWHPLSLLANLVVSPLSRIDSSHRLDPAPYEAQSDATLPSKGSRCESWASVVSASAGSTTSAKVVPRSIFSAIDELQGLASSRMVEAVQPLRGVVDSLHGLLLQAGNLLERAEAALSRLSVVPIVEKPPPTSPPLSELDVDLVDGGVAELYDCFSPRATIASSTLPTFPTVDEVSIMTPAPVLQIMPELHKLCEELISHMSGMHLKMGSLVDSTVALTLTPAPLQPSQGFPDVTSTTDDVATLSSEFVG